MDTPELRGQEWHKEVFATIAAFAPLCDATPKVQHQCLKIFVKMGESEGK